MADNHHLQDEEEEEEEPKLKYERVGRGVEELLQRDTVSCLVAHEKFIVRPFLLIFPFTIALSLLLLRFSRLFTASKFGMAIRSPQPVVCSILVVY